MPPPRSTSSLARTSSLAANTMNSASNNNNNKTSGNASPALKRTSSTVKAQNLASSVASAFARTNSNMAQAMAQMKEEQEHQQQRNLKKIQEDKEESEKKQRSASSIRAKMRAEAEKKAREEDEKFVGNAFDPLPDDVNLDDAVDDLLPRPGKDAARLQLRGHGDSVKSCSFDPHHRLLFTASWDGLVLVWNLEAPSSTPVARLQHREWVNVVATTYVPDLTVVSVTEDGYLFAWQCEEFMIEKNIASAATSQQKQAPDDNTATTLLAEGHHKKIEIVAQIQVSFGALTCLVIHSDYNFAFASSGDTTFGIHLSSMSILREYVTATEAMALATVDAALCIAQRSGAISLYDVVGSFILRELTGHQGPVRCLSVIDAYTIMSAGEDMSVRVWNIASGSCQSNRRRVHNRPIVAISHFYTDRDRMVVTAGMDGCVKVSRQSNGVGVATYGLLANCFCIVPPIAVDASNVEDVVEMLTAGKGSGGDDAEKKMLAGANTNTKKWSGDGDADDGEAEIPLSPTKKSGGGGNKGGGKKKTTSVKSKTTTTKKAKINSDDEGNNDDDEEEGGMEYTATAVFDMRQATTGASRTKSGGDFLQDVDDDHSVSLSSPLTIPGTGRVIQGAHISRHARWSFFQTLVCGGPTGRVTRLSLEGAIAKDTGASRGTFRY